MLKNCLAHTPEQTIGVVTESGLRGYGGAGFRTGLKWQLCRDAPGDEKYVICNADEGEPGTFKDRALLTRSPKDVFMGMVIAAYAIGSSHGIVYLRAEYVYLKRYLKASFSNSGTTGCSDPVSADDRDSTSTSASRWVPVPTSVVKSPR